MPILRDVADLRRIMFEEARESNTASGLASDRFPGWTDRLAAELAGNAGLIHAPVLEWLRRSGHLPQADFAPAAVLAAIVEREAGPGLLFTRRHDDLLRHGGQVAFPGGGAEPADRDPEETALREAEEEVGLSPARVRVLGRLPRYPTTSGYLVTPVVAYIRNNSKLTMQANEVSDIFTVPLDVLLDDSRWRDRPLEYDGERVVLPELTWEGRRIWGATAGMLQLLLPALRKAGIGT